MMRQNIDFRELRKKTEELRYNLVAMMDYAGSGHPGGSLSCLEVLTTLYYTDFLKVSPDQPDSPVRDRLIMSKGHASPTLYVILADLGFFPKDMLKEFDQNDSALPKHCNRFHTPGIDASTGALGQGMSIAVGMAISGKIEDADYKVYGILGDGECQSGEIWEAAMSAAKYKLDNLKVIVDNNRLQIDGFTDDIMALGNQAAKWEAFGWYVKTCDGHDLEAVYDALSEMDKVKDRPAVLIADTTKGKGVSFMENEADWHSRKMTKEEGIQALGEIAEAYESDGFGAIEDAIIFLNKEELSVLKGKGC